METRNFKIEKLAVKTSDLQIGNWVYYNGKPMQVKGVYHDNTIYLDFEGNDGGVIEVIVDGVEPIRLTPEIMKNSGFINDYFVKYVLSLDDELFVQISEKENVVIQSPFGGELEFMALVEAKYVHQLQNILTLLGIDKEIKL